MNAATLRTVLEETLNAGDRVAVGFADRSFFVSEIAAVEIAPIEKNGSSDGDTLFTVTGMVYDTDHSRQATPETIYFQASSVVSLARPAQPQS